MLFQGSDTFVNLEIIQRSVAVGKPIIFVST